jgi:hypothetical protein
MLYAFDLLELDGEDLRALPLGDRKKRLANGYDVSKRVCIRYAGNLRRSGADKVDERTLELKDEPTKKILTQQLAAFAKFIERVGA